MQWRQIATILLALALAPVAAKAGAWGFGSFENDAALDWLQNDFEISGAAAIDRTINAALRNRGMLEVDLASSVVAACEFVAAWQGRATKGIPDVILEPAGRLKGTPGDKLRERAREALDQVVKDSELQELIAEGGGTEYEDWKKAMADLRARL